MVENMDVDFGCKDVYAWDRLFVGFATKGEVGQLPTRDERGRSVATGFSIARGSILTSELEEKV